MKIIEKQRGDRIVMKKCIKQVACMLACCVTLSSASALNVQAATTSSVNKQAGAAYAKIIQAAQKEYNGYKKNANGYTDKLKYFFDESITFSSNFVYRIADLNGDKVPELLIGTKYDSSSGELTAVYTYKSKKAVKLLKSSGPRDRLSLCKNGIIENSGSSSASDSETTYYKIAKGGKLKSVVKMVFKDSEQYKIVNGKKTNLSDAECTKLYKKYSQKAKSDFYEGTTKAVNGVKKGSFTYKGQKHWKVEM